MSAKTKERATESGHSCPRNGGLENPSSVEGWEFLQLGQFAQAKGGYGFPIDRQGKKTGTYPFFKVSDMNLPANRKNMIDSNNWVDEDDLAALKAKTFPSGAIVFPKIGATILTNKKRLLVRASVVDNNVMAVVIQDASRCGSDFLYYWFRTIDLGKLANPGTVPSITSSRIHDTPVLLPPLPEQRKIAAVLGVVQRAMEQQERLLALTAELKKALLHQLFIAGLRGEPQKQTEIGPVPQGWEVKPLGDFARAKGGFGFPLDRQGKKSGQFPFFKVSDMNLPGNEKHMIKSNNWVDADDLVALKAKPYPKDAVVFPKIGATILTNKKRLLTRDSLVDNNVVAIVVDDAERCRPEFLYQWFQTVDLGRLANPGTVPSITSTRLHATLVPLPKPQEQDEMCAAFVALDRKKDLHAAKRAALTALFRTLLHELMTARRRVHNLELDGILGQAAPEMKSP